MARSSVASTTTPAIERAESALSAARRVDDPLFPVALVRAHRALLGGDDAPALLRAWAPITPREAGTVRYRWAINARYPTTWPGWVGEPATWHPWRTRDDEAWRQSPDARTKALDRYLTPLILADSLDFLVEARSADGEPGELAQAFLDEALPKVRRDAADWVQERHAWADTWALWAMARRPGALDRLYPFASAIADAYAWTANRQGGIVLGTRFPFHEVPLVSASAQLAVGLVALGIHPRLTGHLAAWVRSQQRPDGSWGDGGGRSDVLTTFVAADLLASLDPAYDPAPTAAWFATQQRPDGWWRASGPEATWLTAEIAAWLRRAERPFAERFTWPHLAVTNRDRRSGLPFYGYFSDLERLFAEVPALAAAPIEVVFSDLAHFGEYNNAKGMEQGDRVIRSFAQALARIPNAMAIRDGGDEFIVLGPPTGNGLHDRVATFRSSWAAEFAAEYGKGAVAPRMITARTTGARIVEARNELGKVVADVKKRNKEVSALGVQEHVGSI